MLLEKAYMTSKGRSDSDIHIDLTIKTWKENEYIMASNLAVRWTSENLKYKLAECSFSYRTATIYQVQPPSSPFLPFKHECDI